MHQQDIDEAISTMEDALPAAVAVLRHVTTTKGVVTTPMLISAGALTGPQVNHVRALVTLLNWILLYPCGRTYRWYVTDEGRAAARRYSQHSQ